MTVQDHTEKNNDKSDKKKKRKNEKSNVKGNDEVKRRKTKEENSDQSPNNSSSKLIKESECKSENENKEQNKKAEKRKERRQKKKEKKALLIKQNHIHEGKGQNRAIRYLDAWQSLQDGKQSSWKFEKCRQIWLLQNAYDDTKIPDSKFDSLLKYIATIQGKMKEMTIETAKKKIERAEIVKQEDIAKLEPIEANTKDKPPEKKTKKSKKKSKKKVEIPKDEILTEKAVQRASEIIEMLSD